MNSALDDIIIVIDWLAAQKTPTGEVAEALDRLHNRAVNRIPVDVVLSVSGGNETPLLTDPHRASSKE